MHGNLLYSESRTPEYVSSQRHIRLLLGGSAILGMAISLLSERREKREECRESREERRKKKEGEEEEVISVYDSRKSTVRELAEWRKKKYLFFEFPLIF